MSHHRYARYFLSCLLFKLYIISICLLKRVIISCNTFFSLNKVCFLYYFNSSNSILTKFAYSLDLGNVLKKNLIRAKVTPYVIRSRLNVTVLTFPNYKELLLLLVLPKNYLWYSEYLILELSYFLIF